MFLFCLRLAAKLFGSSRLKIKETNKIQRVMRNIFFRASEFSETYHHLLQVSRPWVIHPCSKFRFYWDICMLMLLIANLIILPVAISFFNDDLSTSRIIFNVVSDTIFLCDIVINFRTGALKHWTLKKWLIYLFFLTGYKEKDSSEMVILEPKLIARKYIKSWYAIYQKSALPFSNTHFSPTSISLPFFRFVLDLISTIPVDYIFLVLDSGLVKTDTVWLPRMWQWLFLRWLWWQLFYIFVVMIIFRLVIFSHSFQQFIRFECLYLTFDNSVQTLNQKISKKESMKKLPSKSQLSILRTGMLKPFGLVPNQLTAHRCKNSIFLPSYIN